MIIIAIDSHLSDYFACLEASVAVAEQVREHRQLTFKPGDPLPQRCNGVIDRVSKFAAV